MWYIIIIALIILIIVSIYGFLKARDVFLEHWVPALITGLFLVSILPVVNHAYWKRKINYDKCVQDRIKRYEIVGSTARVYTTLFKTLTRIHNLFEEQSTIENKIKKLSGKENINKDIMQVYNNRLSTLNALRSDLEKERIKLEGEIGAISALIAHYIPEVSNQYFTLAKSYDNRTSMDKTFLPKSNDPVVQDTNKLIEKISRF